MRTRRPITPGWGLALAGLLALGTACAGSVAPPPDPVLARGAKAPSEGLRARVVRHAEAMLGTPYRYGGSTPRGFDCSGLVLYSYGRAGVDGLPRTASALEDRARAIELDELRPADLLFFRLDGAKARHVAIYAGDGHFIHAPSPGRRVERVSLGHVYWRERLGRAGRLLP